MSDEQPAVGAEHAVDESVPADGPPRAGLALAEYASALSLPARFLRESLGLRELHVAERPAVAIPYRDSTGSEGAVQFRCALDGPDSVRWRKGSRPLLYGQERLPDARRRGWLTVVDGTADVHVLGFHGSNAVGIADGDAWNEERDAQLLDGIARIYVVVAPGPDGEATLAWIATSRIRERVRLVRLDDVPSVSELRRRDPREFRATWKRARSRAVPWQAAEDQRRAERHAALGQQCAALARSPRILDRVVDAAQGLGLAGESRIVKLLYVVLTSRLLDKVVSIVVKGPSSAGKSFVVQTVVRMFPPSAVHELTGLSEKALMYGSESLQHRHLVIYEAAGLTNAFTTYTLRTLLSEGRIEYETVERAGGSHRSRRITREGPTGLILTTTAAHLHAENETRMLSVTMSDSPEQTKRIMRALADSAGGPPELEEWHALQGWLEGAEHRVVIPYGRKLADQIRPIAVRLRRDFGAVLALIRAHALLHQASRDKDPDGRIVASLDDYRVVRGLVESIVAETVGSAVPRKLRETVEAITRLTRATGKETGLTALARELRLDKSSASRRVHQAIEAGYVENRETMPGREARLSLRDPLPDSIPILPLPKALAADRCTIARGSEGNSPPSPQGDADPRSSEPGSSPTPPRRIKRTPRRARVITEATE